MAPTARAALLCGDPARALLLAQDLLTEPRMSNHHRGLWGYWGTTHEGAELTIQATGIGGPSAAVVLGELIEAGLTHAIRIGTCTSADGSLPLGTGVVAATAAAPGTAPAAADRALSDALTAAGAGPALALLSLEHPHSPPGNEHTAGAAADGRAGAGDPFDLQTATLLRARLGPRHRDRRDARRQQLRRGAAGGRGAGRVGAAARRDRRADRRGSGAGERLDLSSRLRSA